MAPNHKLTNLIKGRTINGSGNSGDVMTISFTDGSTMTVKTAANPRTASTGGTVKAVRRAGTELDIEFESGSTLAIETAEETSSVMVRDTHGSMEYAD